MAYYKQVLALALINLCVLFNNGVLGARLVAIEGGQTEDKEGRSIGAHPRRIIANLFSNPTDDQSFDFNIHHAGFSISDFNFKGTRARISTWSITDVSSKSESAAFIATANENTNSAMVAGFHVYPSLYSGRTELRLFAAWTVDNGGMMCYSTESDCQGFVLSNITGAPVPGQTFAPLSTYSGKDYFVTLSIRKDDRTQDWSLYRDDNDNPILIGWWPKTLFNNTFDYATKLIWAGGVMYPKNETSPPMGSGHPATEGANKAAYISNIKVFDQYSKTNDPDQYKSLKELTDRADCFTTDGFKYSKGKGCIFYYGGPAGCKN